MLQNRESEFQAVGYCLPNNWQKKCYVYGWICVCVSAYWTLFFCYCFIRGLCSLWKNEKIYLPHLPIPPHPEGNISIGCLCVWWHHCLFFSSFRIYRDRTNTNRRPLVQDVVGWKQSILVYPKNTKCSYANMHHLLY